jgi:hypothetical protein
MNLISWSNSTRIGESVNLLVTIDKSLIVKRGIIVYEYPGSRLFAVAIYDGYFGIHVYTCIQENKLKGDDEIRTLYVIPNTSMFQLHFGKDTAAVEQALYEFEDMIYRS